MGLEITGEIESVLFGKLDKKEIYVKLYVVSLNIGGTHHGTSNNIFGQ